jgi:hypothetical protein
MFSKSDANFYSCGLEGTIYEWNTYNWGRKDYITFNAKFTGLALTK